MEKIFFKTFGCSNNFAESEMMRGIAKENFDVISDPEKADVIVLNICTVKGDDSALSTIKKTKEEYPYKKLIIAGCIPIHLIKQIRKVDSECAMLTTHNINQINEVIEEVINEHPIEIVAKEKLIKAGFNRDRKNKIVGIVPISNSCLGKCTYCSVKPIKGVFYSFPEEDIIKEVKKAVLEGCKEIWITSQDNGCYGIDLGTNLAKLLKKIVEIEGEFLVRVGMMNPNNIKLYLDELIDVFRNKKMFKFIHIPVQTGSNKVLKEMKRQYKIEEFKEIINKFRNEIPKITVATDIIVGFPTEKGDDFNETIELVKWLKADVLNYSRFRKRPGTKAAKHKQLSAELVKDRSKELGRVNAWVGLEVNRKWKLWEGGIIIDEEGKDDTLVGRNAYYKPIIIQKSTFEIGDKVKVKVRSFTQHDLRA